MSTVSSSPSCCHSSACDSPFSRWRPRRGSAFAFPRRIRWRLGSLAFTVLLAGCHSTPPPTPLNQLNAEQAQGYAVFQTRCALCHYERTDEDRKGPPLNGLFKKRYLHSGAPATDERVTATILHGHGLMPAQPNLDPDALAALLAYLHTV